MHYQNMTVEVADPRKVGAFEARSCVVRQKSKAARNTAPVDSFDLFRLQGSQAPWLAWEGDTEDMQIKAKRKQYALAFNAGLRTGATA